jgi:hypothetical protein
MEGGAAAGGLAGGGALSNASRPLLGRGGRGGSNVKLYRPSAGSMVLHDASGSGITDSWTGFKTIPPQMLESVDGTFDEHAMTEPRRRDRRRHIRLNLELAVLIGQHRRLDKWSIGLCWLGFMARRICPG